MNDDFDNYYYDHRDEQPVRLSTTNTTITTIFYIYLINNSPNYKLLLWYFHIIVSSFFVCVCVVLFLHLVSAK
jgi:hypothetical protein